MSAPLAPPFYYNGRKLKNVKITPMTIAADGTLTAGTVIGDIATAFFADHVIFHSSLDTEEISAANAAMRNNVAIKDDFTVEIGEIKPATGDGLSTQAWITTDYIKIEAVVNPGTGQSGFGSAGLAASDWTIQAIAIRGDYQDESGEGKSVLTSTWKACGLPIAFCAGTALVY